MADKYDFLLLHAEEKDNIIVSKSKYSLKVGCYSIRNKIYIHTYKAIKSFKPDVIIHQGSPGIISMPFTWFFAKLFSSKFVLWTHGYERRKGFKPFSSVESALRLVYYKISDALLFYTEGRKNYFLKYIADKKCFVAHNTLDSVNINSIRSKLAIIGKEQILTELGLNNGAFNLCYIGRLLDEKRPLDVIKIGHYLEVEHNFKLNIHIVGDGPEKINMQNLSESNNMKNVYFHGALSNEEEIGKILFITDVVVNTGYVGLNVNHALLYRTPILTTKSTKEGPFHSPEYEYIIDGQTGFLSEGKHIRDYSNIIYSYLLSSDKQVAMKLSIEKYLESNLSIDKMFKGISDCIEYCNVKK